MTDFFPNFFVYVNECLPYSLRGTLHNRFLSHTVFVGKAIWSALRKSTDLEDGFAHATEYSDAHIQCLILIQQWGVGVFTNEMRIAAAIILQPPCRSSLLPLLDLPK